MSTAASRSSTTTYAYANVAYFLTTSTTLLLTALYGEGVYATPAQKRAVIYKMAYSIVLLLFGAFNIPQFFPYTWAHWTAVLIFHTVAFVRGYAGWMGGDEVGVMEGWAMLGSGVLVVWGVGLLVFAGEGRRARSSYLFTPEEKRKTKVEKREKRFGKLEEKMG